MSEVMAILSLLHQREGNSSADRLFRGEQVLSWTLRRLQAVPNLKNLVVLHWDDQQEKVDAAKRGTLPLSQGARMNRARMQAISAALRWTNGWRGGLLGASCFDAGFDPAAIRSALESTGADSALLIDPDAALVDPELICGLINHAESRPEAEYVFSPAAPGLSGAIVRRTLLDRLSRDNLHPGRLLHYFPDRPGIDPIGKNFCAPIPSSLARTTHRFTFESRRQIHRIEVATADLNGQLPKISAEELLERINRLPTASFPHDVELEITTQRAVKPVFSPKRYLDLDRPDMTLEQATRIFNELSRHDVRLSLTGTGDPLCHPAAIEIIRAAHDAGIRAIQLETDLLNVSPPLLCALAESHLDILSVHIPALFPAAYAAIMGEDRLPEVLKNLSFFAQERDRRNSGTPLIVPLFTKCKENLHEMEAWYDHWLMAVGSAVITGPSDCAGLIPDVSVADMSPQRRVPCRRLSSRLTIVSTGEVVPCSEDVTGRQKLGNLANESIAEIWRQGGARLRALHQAGAYGALPACRTCKAWHRP